MEPGPDEKQEALRLKTIAETKYTNSNLKSALKHAKKAHRVCPNLDGLYSMLTAFKILHMASKTHSDFSEWYKILQVEPFSHINTIKKQYKKLALILHPDKNSYFGCEEAFKLVGEGFRVLSDKIRRKEYDMRLRIRLQEERISDNSVVETFWTACSRCRLFHQFERKYLGHNLICPSCKKSFEAVEVEEKKEEDNEMGVRVSVWNERLRRKVVSSKKFANGKISGVRLRRKISDVGEDLEKPKAKRAKFGEEIMTLAELQREIKQKARLEKEEVKKKQENLRNKVMEEEDGVKIRDLKKLGDVTGKKRVALKRSTVMEVDEGDALDKIRNSRKRENRKNKDCRDLKSGGMEIIEEEDSKFYEFDKDRAERSFKKGQVWATYDKDRIPSSYCLIDEIVSVNPFEVNLSWLDLQSSGDKRLIGWDKMGFHLSCGKFKVSRMTRIKTRKIFSHVVDCERAAREVYRIYPKKGSVWALYNERNSSSRDEQCYGIVVCLTSYSEMHGLSMAYLEKIDGFRTVFKRCEVGYQAVRLLRKEDIRLLSHQIPAKKLSGNEVPANLKECWELDPAALPSNLNSVDLGMITSTPGS